MSESTIAVGVILLLVWLVVIGFLLKQAKTLMNDRYGVMGYVYFPLKMMIALCCLLDAIMVGIVQGQWWLYNIGTSNVAVLTAVLSGGFLRPWVLLGVCFMLSETLSELIRKNRRKQQEEEHQQYHQRQQQGEECQGVQDQPAGVSGSRMRLRGDGDNHVVLQENNIHSNDDVRSGGIGHHYHRQGEYTIPPPGFESYDDHQHQSQQRHYPIEDGGEYSDFESHNHQTGGPRSSSRGAESNNSQGGASSNGPTTTTRGPGSNPASSPRSPLQTPRFDRDSLDSGTGGAGGVLGSSLPPLSGGRLPGGGGVVVPPLVVNKNIIFNERGEIEYSVVPIGPSQVGSTSSGGGRPGTAGAGGGGPTPGTTPRGFEEKGGRLSSSTPEGNPGSAPPTRQYPQHSGSFGPDGGHPGGSFDGLGPTNSDNGGRHGDSHHYNQMGGVVGQGGSEGHYSRRDNYNISGGSDVGLGLGHGLGGGGGQTGFEFGGNGVAPVVRVDPTSFWYVPARRYLTVKASRRWALGILCWFLLHIIFAVVAGTEEPDQPPICESTPDPSINLNLVSCRTIVTSSRYRWVPPRVFAILHFIFLLFTLVIMMRVGMKYSKSILHRPTRDRFYKTFLALLATVVMTLIFAMVKCTDAGRTTWSTAVVCGFDNVVSMLLYIITVRRMVGLAGS